MDFALHGTLPSGSPLRMAAFWLRHLGDHSPGPAPFAWKITIEELKWRVETGMWQVRMYGGKFAGVSQKADNSALLQLVGRLHPLPAKYRLG